MLLNRLDGQVDGVSQSGLIVEIMNNLILRVSFEDHGDDAAGQSIVHSLDTGVKVLTQELLLLLRVTKLVQ